MMSQDERQQLSALLSRIVESDVPEPGNLAVFYNAQDEMVYSGVITEWPTIVAADVEWGKVEEKDATKLPFSGLKVRFWDMVTAHQLGTMPKSPIN